MIHHFRYWSVFAIALLIGCGSPPEDSPRERPSSEAGPEVVDPAVTARLELIRKSIAEGMDVNQADADGRTALMMAAFEGYTEVVKLLLQSGAEVDFLDGSGRSALMYASSGPFPETVAVLIQGGADINLVDSAEGWTSLMVAAAEGHQPVVEVLLRNGAEIEITDKDGDAAIQHASERGQTQIVELLASWSGNR